MTTHDVVAFLSRVDLFSGLGEEALEALARRMSTRRITAGEVLFLEGETSQGLFLLLEGRVKVYRSADDRTQTLAIGEPGLVFSVVALCDGGPYPISARALGDGRVLFLSQAEFHTWCAREPELAMGIIRNLGAKLRLVTDKLVDVTLHDVPTRVARYLLQEARKAGAVRPGGTYSLPVSQAELAEELGTTREGVSRALAGLRRDRAIYNDGAEITVLDPASLEAAARGGRSPATAGGGG